MDGASLPIARLNPPQLRWRTPRNTPNGRARPLEPKPVLPGIQRDEAGLILSQALRDGGRWLAPDEVRRLLALYGVPTVEQRVVSTPEEAAAAAAEPAGVEMLVGVVNDRQFGPSLACGAGGTLVEVLKDVSVRLTPVTASDAASMLRELRSFPRLTGYPGGQPCDVAALDDVLLRISAMVEDHSTIAEVDCNPVIVSASGAVVVDARVRVEKAAERRPLGARA